MARTAVDPTTRLTGPAPMAGTIRPDAAVRPAASARRPLFAAALSLGAEQGAAHVWQTVATWLRRNRRETIEPGLLANQGLHQLASGATLEVLYTDSESPYLHAIRYVHPDSELAGRRWLVEMSLRAEIGSPTIEVSVVLATEDVSRTPLPPARVTRPVLVRLLMQHNAPAAGTPGLQLMELTAANAGDFRTSVHSTQRRTPIVLISPTPTGAYLLEARRVLEQLAGVADVYTIPVGANTRALAEAVGEDVVPWNGGLRIVYPVRPGPYATPAPTRRITPEELDDWRIAGASAQQEILGIVATRSLRARLARHITLEQVQEERIRRKVARNRRDDTTEVTALRTDIGLLEDIITEREAEISRLERELEDRDDQLDELRDEGRAQQYTIEGLKHQLTQASTTPDIDAAFKLDDDCRDAMVRTLSGDVSVSDALRTVAALYPDRLVVLDSAYQSAQASAEFRRPEEALALLLKLAGPYWDALQGGNGDAQARQVFGSRFAAQESDRVTNNSAGRDYRTFVYRGEEIVMVRHLKIGRKDSVAETLRIHFHWDAANRLIVVGHCGPHLDFN